MTFFSNGNNDEEVETSEDVRKIERDYPSVVIDYLKSELKSALGKLEEKDEKKKKEKSKEL